MNTLSTIISEGIELLDADTIKEMENDGDYAILAVHYDETNENKFMDAGDVINKKDEYVAVFAGDYGGPGAAEDAFWKTTSISRLENYIRAQITVIKDHDCVDMIATVCEASNSEKEIGYALLYPQELKHEHDDRLALSEKIERDFPGAAEQTLFHWKNGWMKTDWNTQGYEYDSNHYRIGWYVPNSNSSSYC